MKFRRHIFENIEITKTTISGELDEILKVPESVEQFGKAIEFIIKQTLLSIDKIKYYEDKDNYYFVGWGNSIYYIFLYNKEDNNILFDIIMYYDKKRSLSRLYDNLERMFKPKVLEYNFRKEMLQEYVNKKAILPILFPHHFRK